MEWNGKLERNKLSHMTARVIINRWKRGKKMYATHEHGRRKRESGRANHYATEVYIYIYPLLSFLQLEIDKLLVRTLYTFGKNKKKINKKKNKKKKQTKKTGICVYVLANAHGMVSLYCYLAISGL